jgi:SAM-dependent methyltransferase
VRLRSGSHHLPRSLDHDAETGAGGAWPAWCCSYCAAPLGIFAHGLHCEAEGRFFATVDGVHRLIPDERRREVAPWLAFNRRLRRAQEDPLQRAVALRLAEFPRAVAHAETALGSGAWRVLEVGAESCAVSLQLLARGHRVAAVDVDLDPEHGLPAATRLSPMAAALPRAESDVEALPFEPGAFDLVVAAGALHEAPHLSRALIELRRVTRRGGVLLAWDSPVFKRRQDGEALVAQRMERQSELYGVASPRESAVGYLAADELPDVFGRAGWSLPALSPRGREPLFPVLLAVREG